MTLYGGTKIIIKDADGIDTVIREIIDKQHFLDIFKHIISIEKVSHESLQGLILRVTIPEIITPFRSDIFDANGELLTSDNYMNAATGQKLTQHILKCCVIEEETQELEQILGKKKYTTKLKNFTDEFHAQAYIYTSTMAYGGSPVCPDVSALLTFTYDEFKRVFFDEPDNMPKIVRDNMLFKYLLRQKKTVGIIVMESLPSIYENLGKLYIESTTSPKNVELLSKVIEFTEYVFAIHVIIVYRSGIIPLDAHLNNWMYITERNWQKIPPITQIRLNLCRVKAIDFGQLLFIKGVNNLNKIKTLTQQFFERFTNSQIDKLRQFAVILNVDPSSITTAEQAGDVMKDKIENLNFFINENKNGNILFSKSIDSEIPEWDQGINLIHRIIVLSGLIESFHSTLQNLKKGVREIRFQMSKMYEKAFGVNFNNPISIIENVNIDLNVYAASLNPHDRSRILSTYTHIQNYIIQYLISEPRGVFPNPPELIIED